MACGTVTTAELIQMLLDVCLEPLPPESLPAEVVETDVVELASALVHLTRNEIGEVGEAAAAAFLADKFGMELQGSHGVNARGVDLILITRDSGLVTGEVKATAGLSKNAQAANQRGTAERMSSMLSARQRDPVRFANLDPAIRAAELDAAAVTEFLALRVDVLSETVDVWEHNAEGGWDLRDTYPCPTADLVTAALDAREN